MKVSGLATGACNAISGATIENLLYAHTCNSISGPANSKNNTLLARHNFLQSHVGI